MIASNLLIAKLFDNRYRLVLHLIYILLITCFWFLWELRTNITLLVFLKTLAFSATYILIAYFNIYFLFPRFFMKGRIIVYIVISVLSFFTGYFVQQLIYFTSREAFLKEMSETRLLIIDMSINAYTFLMVICIGLAFKMVKMWYNSQSRLMIIEQEMLKAKLNNLKSQVNPHFLFNTFNNLYVLTKTKPLLASEMILGLSDIMRYQLNESNTDKINIAKEIEYIRNLLNLEKLRKDSLDIKIEYDNSVINGLTIEPLLFTTLIENAIKHGSQKMENAFIYVQLGRNKQHFFFRVSNSKPLKTSTGTETTTGLGIENLKARLNILYPGKHLLELSNEKEIFTANMQLTIT